MRPQKLIPYLFITLMLLSVSVIIYAAPTGRIAGEVTDKETGDPVIGASVFVVGTKLGAQTDFDGKFVVAQIEPDTYVVKVTPVDYTTVEVTDVVVKSDLTFKVSVTMEKKVTDIDETITVKADRDIIDKFEVSNQTVIAKTPPSLPSSPQVLSAGEGKKRASGDCQGSVPGREGYGFPPAHGGTDIVNGEAFDAMFFKNYGVNPFVDTEDDHLSTFAIDVDDASYVMTRSYLGRGYLPPEEAVRTEEFINHFDYEYEPPDNKAFTIHMEGAPSRFGQNCRLLKIGIKGREIRAENRKPANLVFVIDISGSMARENRLSLVKKALLLLVDELRQEDRVGIVTYGSTGHELLQPTSLAERDVIAHAVSLLVSHGSTYAEEGIRLGYRMAERSFEEGRINRIILCSDGVANVGRTGADDILKQIKRYADKGITLTSVGFGMGNFNDILLEKLGNKGNGHYAYVDNLAEARRIFVENLTGTLQVIARDVKIQVDFNPDVVRSYRLLGYENRDVEDDKFRDDTEDGGEIGSGHEVTALYEIKFHKEDGGSKVGTIYVRYQDPDGEDVTEVNRAIERTVFRDEFSRSTYGFKLATAAAEFAEILRKSYWAKGSDLGEVLALVKEITLESESPDVIELLGLVSKAAQYRDQLAGN